MTTRQPVDYLDTLAYRPGEFEATQRRLDELLSTLSGQLTPSIAISLRAELSGAASEGLLDLARATLDGLLEEAAPSDEEAASAADPLADELRAALSANLPVTDEAVQAEAVSCAHELSHLVLAQWMDPLATAQIGSPEGLPLNANMLPGGQSIEAILEGVACGSYGLETPFVIKALRRFQQLLVSDANDRPIELGPRMLIAADATDLDRPYRLFHDPAAASAFSARRQQAWTRPVDNEALQERCIRLVGAIRQACWPTFAPAMDASHFATAAIGLCTEMGQHSIAAQRYRRLANGLVGMGQHSPQRLLVESVLLGVDQFAGGLGVSLPEATRQLERCAPAIKDKLSLYANVRQVPVAVANDIFMVFVVAGIESATLPTRIALGGAESSASGAEAFDELLEAHAVGDWAAAQIIDDSCLGAAFLEFEPRGLTA